MDKWQALQAFWSSFGLPAFDENTVPDDAEMPYITYEAKTSNLDHPVYLSGQIFYFSSSWASICKKADEIEDYIWYGFKIIPCDGGYLYITKGSPFSQKMDEPSNDSVRRVIINISVEYLTK